MKDRRQHKRYLTLKNFAIACAVGVVVVLGVFKYSELRRPASNEYGRLVKREIPARPVEPKPMEVVRGDAPPIDDQASADPMLVEPMAREQWLGVDTTSSAVTPPTPSPVAASGKDVAIVGGPEGVSIVQQKKRHAVLAGGFGRSE